MSKRNNNVITAITVIVVSIIVVIFLFICTCIVLTFQWHSVDKKCMKVPRIITGITGRSSKNAAFSNNNRYMFFMTFNTSLLPYELPFFVNRVGLHPQHLQDIIYVLEKFFETTCVPDVLCLQEVFTMEAREILCNQFLRQYYTNIVLFTGGLVTASQFHIQRFYFQPFIKQKGLDKWVNKGFGCIFTNNLIVYNVHMQYQHEKIKRAQLKQLLEHIQSNDETDKPTFILGDFNLKPVDLAAYSPFFKELPLSSELDYVLQWTTTADISNNGGVNQFDFVDEFRIIFQYWLPWI